MDIDRQDVVILDFETTGISPWDSRIIEVGAARIKDGEIVDTFATLCNPGQRIPSFITQLTGITNAMLKGQPPPELAMLDFYNFLGTSPLLAHNASFDGRFLRSEMERIGNEVQNPMLCTMLLARRLITDSPNHKLSVLKEHLNYRAEQGHQDHRALDDVKVTAHLWKHLCTLVANHTGRDDLPFEFYQKLSRVPKARVEDYLRRARAVAEV